MRLFQRIGLPTQVTTWRRSARMGSSRDLGGRYATEHVLDGNTHGSTRETAAGGSQDDRGRRIESGRPDNTGIVRPCRNPETGAELTQIAANANLERGCAGNRRQDKA